MASTVAERISPRRLLNWWCLADRTKDCLWKWNEMDPDLAPMIVTDLKEGTSFFFGSAVVFFTLGHVKH